MKLLAIDTSTEACSAALLDGDSIIERFEIAPRRHAELILTMLDQVMAEGGLEISDIDGLACGRGPGAFTGVRIALSVMQGIALGRELPIAPVSSLAATAYGAWRTRSETHLATAFDARMGEVYWGAFCCDENGVSTIVEECVTLPDQVPTPNANDWFGIGSGWASYPDQLQKQMQNKFTRLRGIAAEHYPHARDVAVLARGMFARNEQVIASLATPVYLRDRVAQKPNTKPGP